ncbi:MAG: 4Fe-4S dicluster domain-containing protein [Campylobacter sp.]|nr:4Fe-4S dicluster domain-containing protein [Campylobacter sp.]
MKKYVMVYDENLCIGCQACSVACRNENHVPNGYHKLKVRGRINGEFPKLSMDFKRQSCEMCADAPCVSVCLTEAMFKTADGVTLIDQKKCIGCKYCILACPYDALYLQDDGKVGKCTFCYDNRVKAGKDPSCVTVCPTNALVFGDIADKKIQKEMKKSGFYLPKEKLGTKPALGFIANKK